MNIVFDKLLAEEEYATDKKRFEKYHEEAKKEAIKIRWLYFGCFSFLCLMVVFYLLFIFSSVSNIWCLITVGLCALVAAGLYVLASLSTPTTCLFADDYDKYVFCPCGEDICYPFMAQRYLLLVKENTEILQICATKTSINGPSEIYVLYKDDVGYFHKRMIGNADCKFRNVPEAKLDINRHELLLPYKDMDLYAWTYICILTHPEPC